MSAGAFGILGGTFDPIHAGHVGVAVAVAAAFGLERTLLVPARLPPHRAAPRVSVYHRFAMVALAAMSEEGLVASDLDLHDTGPCFTSTLLDRFLAAGHDRSRMVFITGADAFAEIATWHEYPAVLDRCHFAVVSRPGVPAADLPRRLPELATRFVEVPARAGARPVTLTDAPRIWLLDARTPDVSSTEIRARLRAGDPPTERLPGRVAAYVTRHGLYMDA